MDENKGKYVTARKMIQCRDREPYKSALEAITEETDPVFISILLETINNTRTRYIIFKEFPNLLFMRRM